MASDTKYSIAAGRRFTAAFSNAAQNTRYASSIIGASSQASKLPGAFVATGLNTAKSELNLNKYSVETFDRDAPRGVSPLGLPLFDQINVTSPRNYTFPLDPLIGFEEAKEFLETTTQSGSEVVELVGIKPVEITIQGILWDGSSNYPEQLLRELRTIWKENVVLDVNSRQFNAYEIASIYIKNISYPAVQGFEDTIAYQITARSHRPVELELIEQ